MEISVVANGVQKGISREMVDSLRSQVEEKDRGLQDALVSVTSLERQLGQEQADHRRTKERADLEAARIKVMRETLQRQHEEAIGKIRTERQLEKAELQRQIEYTRKAAESEAGRVQLRTEAEMADLRATNSRLEVDLMKVNKSKAQELQAALDRFDSKLADQAAVTVEAEKRSQDLEKKLGLANIKVQETYQSLEASEEQCQDLERRLEATERDKQKAEELLKQMDSEKKATQTELDDLLMVFGDLEEKVAKYKARLKGLGEQISDGEEDESGGEDDTGDEGGVD